MRISKLREAFRFFSQHAGGVVGENAIGALSLAKADARLARAVDAGRVTVEWEWDDNPDLSWCERCEENRRNRGCRSHRLAPEHVHGLFMCSIRSAPKVCGMGYSHRVYLASCGGIDFGPGDPDIRRKPYRRVMEAELASEAFPARTRAKVPA